MVRDDQPQRPGWAFRAYALAAVVVFAACLAGGLGYPLTIGVSLVGMIVAWVVGDVYCMSASPTRTCPMPYSTVMAATEKQRPETRSADPLRARRPFHATAVVGSHSAERPLPLISVIRAKSAHRGLAAGRGLCVDMGP